MELIKNGTMTYKEKSSKQLSNLNKEGKELKRVWKKINYN